MHTASNRFKPDWPLLVLVLFGLLWGCSSARAAVVGDLTRSDDVALTSDLGAKLDATNGVFAGNLSSDGGDNQISIRPDRIRMDWDDEGDVYRGDYSADMVQLSVNGDTVSLTPNGIDFGIYCIVSGDESSGFTFGYPYDQSIPSYLYGDVQITKGDLAIDTLSVGGTAIEDMIGAVTNDVLQVVSDAAQLNSRTIPVESYTTTYTAPATNVSGTIYVLPQTNSWMAETGTVEFSTDNGEYLVDVSADIVAASASGLTPITPVSTEKTRTSNTSIVFSAYCVDGGNGDYFSYLTNVVVQTYELEGMTPQSITNDGAGIITQCDDLPSDWTVADDGRMVVNVASLVDYIDSRVIEIANEAWNRTPSGQAVPDSRFVTIDEPMIQHGTISYMQSGDYYCQSYVGGDWWQTAEGSEWWIGPAGAQAFGISSTNKLLHVDEFDVSSGVATLDISTNGVAGDPEILVADSLSVDGQPTQWIKCPAQTMTDMTTYWRGQCDATSSQRFYRVVSAGGEQRVTSKYPAIFEQGIDDGSGNILTNITISIGGTNYQFYGRMIP